MSGLRWRGGRPRSKRRYGRYRPSSEPKCQCKARDKTGNVTSCISLQVSCLPPLPSQHVGLKSSYIKNKSFDDEYFKKLILEYINKFGRASRKEIDDLLFGKLSDNLTSQQKRYKITNLLTSLRTNEKIKSGEKRMWYPVK